MGEITMPRLSDTMTEGSVGKWLKKVGDRIESGEVIAEIETDKATMDLPAYESGVLFKIVVAEGAIVEIGTLIGLIGDGKSEPTTSIARSVTTTTPVVQPSTPPAAVAPIATPSEDERVKASPVAKRIADDMGIDLTKVHGTGPGGRIIKENVEEFAEQAGQAPAIAASVTNPSAPAPKLAPPVPPLADNETVPMSRMRRAIARAMNDSKPGIPHIYVTMEIDMAEAEKLREQINTSGLAKLSINDFIMKAAAKALIKVPAVNSSFAVGADGQLAIIRHTQINVSVAVALEDGLIAPVVRDADKKSISAISSEVKDLATRARAGKIKATELDGATFQVSNLGKFDVTEFVSIITAPQAASLAVGTVRQTPIVRNGQIVIGQVMNVTLSADHRVIDGAVAANYLVELRNLLQAPLSLLV